MSHFTKIRTKLVDEETLRTALQHLGYRVEPAGRGVHGFAGQRADARFKVRPGRNRYEIGFAPSPQGYIMIADWWGLRGLDRADFTRSLTRQYALTATLSTLQAKGYRVDEQVSGDDGEIRLVLRRTVGI